MLQPNNSGRIEVTKHYENEYNTLWYINTEYNFTYTLHFYTQLHQRCQKLITSRKQTLTDRKPVEQDDCSFYFRNFSDPLHSFKSCLRAW